MPTNPKKELNNCKRSHCPIACALDIIGDKWSLLVIRDLLFMKKKRFNDFLTSPEKISTNVLTQRLILLEEKNIIKKKAYQENPVRYEYFLTKRGQDLKPTMIEVIKWGNAHIEGTIKPPKEILDN